MSVSMRSPADMQTIQIEITNACNKACSNCTRFCGNHKKPFFMDFDTFKRAVDSLEGFHGITGVMGGEPTLHPEFERFVLYLREKFGSRKQENRLIYPQKEFIKEIHRREFEAHSFPEGVEAGNETGERVDYKMFGPGLWSNMGSTYSKYYEIIQDSFSVQFLNDHINASYHQPGLVSRKDLGILDEEWITIRDNCWIQNQWSACITPKGAFFCEIAGALDMLFDGPGGWRIEPGWWKRKPEDFGEQLGWCELCGFALNTFMRDAEEEIDDVSPTLYEKLKMVGSPRIKAGKVNLLKIEDGMISEDSRVSTKGFSDVAVAQPYIEHYEDRFNKSNSQLFIKKYISIFIPEKDDFGLNLNKALQETSSSWLLLWLTDDKNMQNASEKQMEELIASNILNPGTLHLGEAFAFFSKNAISLRKLGFDGIGHCHSFEELKNAWQQEKVVKLDEVDERRKWRSNSIISGSRYAVWGAGLSGSFLVELVVDSGGEIKFIVDSDPEKEETIFCGYSVHKPAYLMEHRTDIDYLLIGHYSRFNEIYDDACSLGIDRERILRPFEI